MLLEHERNYDLGMDAFVTVCSWSTNGIMIWVWMLWSPHAFGTRTDVWPNNVILKNVHFAGRINRPMSSTSTSSTSTTTVTGTSTSTITTNTTTNTTTTIVLLLLILLQQQLLLLLLPLLLLQNNTTIVLLLLNIQTSLITALSLIIVRFHVIVALIVIAIILTVTIVVGVLGHCGLQHRSSLAEPRSGAAGSRAMPRCRCLQGGFRILQRQRIC